MRTGGWERPVPDLAVGLGFDVHAFAPGRALWLGGLCSRARGLVGHSDGDVVCHAIADALLGAVALGDVGEHFPDTDPENAGLAGAELLGRALRLLADRGRAPVSMDVTVVCERPSIAPRRLEMRDRLARSPVSRSIECRSRPPVRRDSASPGRASAVWRWRWSDERGARDRAPRRRRGDPSRAGARGAGRRRRARHARTPRGPRSGPRGEGARPRDGTAGA